MKTWVLLVAAALVLSCTGRPRIPEPGADQGTVEAADSEPVEGERPPDGAAAVEPTPEVPASQTAEESFVVSEEVYNKTFDEVEEFIRNLNDIIRNRDYQTWLTYLSDEYIQRTGDREYLQEQSEMPLLKKNNIHLESLRDYFEHVVGPSRSQATVDDIEFIDENRVKVISSIRGTRGILYLLVREKESWKIGVWD